MSTQNEFYPLPLLMDFLPAPMTIILALGLPSVVPEDIEDIF